MMRFLRQLRATGAKIGSPFRRLELTFWFVLSPGRQITRPLVDSSCFAHLDVCWSLPFLESRMMSFRNHRLKVNEQVIFNNCSLLPKCQYFKRMKS